MSRFIGPVAVLVTLTLIVTIGGCGGGASDPAILATTSALHGIVYTSGMQPAEAGQAPGAAPLYFGMVTMRRASDDAYVADTMTDRHGRYHVPNLTRGVDLIVICEAPSGEILMTRTRPDALDCTADIDEDTTLATQSVMCMCQTAGDVINDAAQNAAWRDCLQFQRANRYQYGDLNGARPDFTDPQVIEQAAQALLDAATDGS